MSDMEAIARKMAGLLEEARLAGHAQGVADERERVVALMYGEKPPPKEAPAERWTDRQDMLLKELWENTSNTAEQIGAELGRTAQAVYTRVRHRQLKERTGGMKPVVQVQGAPGPRVEKPLPPPPGEMADAATLPPLTLVQAKVFKGLVATLAEDQAKGYHGAATFSQINRNGGTTSASSYVLRQLADLGYVRMAGEFGAPDWRPIAEGEPRVKLFTDGQGNEVRPWTEEEVSGILSLNPEAGDTYHAYGAKIARTENAVQQKARNIGRYDPALLLANDHLRSPSVRLPLPPPEPASEPELERPEEEDNPLTGEGVDIDDLSKAPREVLLALRCMAKDGKASATEKEIGLLADVDPGRLPFAISRCRELRLVRSEDGRWRLTKRGVELAELAHEDEQ